METDQAHNFQSIHSQVKIARKQILDLLQATYGHEPSWRNVRSRLLKILGRDGLEQFFLQQDSTDTATRDMDYEDSRNS